MAYAKIIVNPIAGAGKTRQKWPDIKKLLENIGLDFDYTFTEYQGHAIELARVAMLEGYHLVVAVGGDGTISEVANGIYASGCNKESLLGIISTGTGSDYIRTAGISHDYKEACFNLMKSRVCKVDAGIVYYIKDGVQRQRLFVNFAGLGFDAEIVKATTLTYKNLGSKSSYLLGLFSTLAFFQNQEIDVTIDSDAKRYKICTILMGNGKYAGGGMFTTPDADLKDGLLDVLIVGDLSKPDLLRSLPRIYKGTHLSHPKITLKKAKEVIIKPVKKMSVQADGDLLGEAPVHFSIIPEALNLVI